MASQTSPQWRRAFNTLERAIGSPLERGTTSSQFALGISVARRLRRGTARRLDAAASYALHQIALPSHADMRRLQRQLAGVERELGAIRRDLDARFDRDATP
jgi:hypothetical protein